MEKGKRTLVSYFGQSVLYLAQCCIKYNKRFDILLIAYIIISSNFQLAKKAKVENLQLFIQLHSDNAILSINAEEDPAGLSILS